MKRIISLLLALLMVFSTVVFTLTSCGEEEKKDEKADNTVVNEGPAVEGDIFAERAAISDELPEADFGGKNSVS